MWEIFRKYHYLNTEIAPFSQQYVGIMNGDQLVCHTGVIQAAMKKGVKRVHRLVTLPSYQGLGIGTNFIKFVADIYAKDGLKFNLITTTPALRIALERDPKWTLKRAGYVPKAGNADKLEKNFGLGHLNNTFSCNRETWSFDYVSEYQVTQPEEKQEQTDNIIQLQLF